MGTEGGRIAREPPRSGSFGRAGACHAEPGQSRGCHHTVRSASGFIKAVKPPTRLCISQTKPTRIAERVGPGARHRDSKAKAEGRPRKTIENAKPDLLHDFCANPVPLAAWLI